MLYKRLKSVVLLSLSLCSICNAAEKQENNWEKCASIAKYLSPLPPIALCGFALRFCYKNKLKWDLEKNLDCNIIHYLDEKDKISLTKDEIERYSSVYSRFLFKLYRDSRRLKKEGIYDTLKACALFLIRTDARLKRNNKQPSYEVFIKETKRYLDKKGVCILSKSFFENDYNNSNNPKDIDNKRENYLYYDYETPLDSLNIIIPGKDIEKYGGWVIGLGTEELRLGYASSYDMYQPLQVSPIKK